MEQEKEKDETTVIITAGEAQDKKSQAPPQLNSTMSLEAFSVHDHLVLNHAIRRRPGIGASDWSPVRPSMVGCLARALRPFRSPSRCWDSLRIPPC